MLLLEDGAGGALATVPRLRDRIAARVRADHLDARLAAGASPDATPSLALRAQTLVNLTTRLNLAAAVWQLLARAFEPEAVALRALPLCRDRIQAAAADFADVSRRLAANGPVSARGVAQLSLLLSRGDGPLYNRDNAEDVIAVVRRAHSALDPLAAA